MPIPSPPGAARLRGRCRHRPRAHLPTLVDATSMRSPPRRATAQSAVWSTAQPCATQLPMHRRVDADAPRLRLLHHRAQHHDQQHDHTKSETPSSTQTHVGVSSHIRPFLGRGRGTMTLLVVVCSTVSVVPGAVVVSTVVSVLVKTCARPPLTIPRRGENRPRRERRG